MRNWFVTLLLLLVVSNAMVAAHAATHVTPDANECELCAAYTDPSPAAPGDYEAPGIASAPVHFVESHATVLRTVEAGSFRQRAPPLASLSR